MKKQSASKCIITSHHIDILAEPEGKTLAKAMIVLNETFQVNSLRIVRGEAGIFLQWTLNPGMEDGIRYCCHPIDNVFRTEVERLLCDEYYRMIDDIEIQELIHEKSMLEVQYDTAKGSGRKVLAEALSVAIKSLDNEIQAGG